MLEEDGIWIESELLMMSLDEASSKSRTETSANGWQEKEGGPHDQHIYLTISALAFLPIAPRSSNVQSLPIIIIYLGLDEYQMVFPSLRTSTNCTLDPE